MVEELKKQELNLVMKELKSYEDNFLTISKDMVKALKKN